MNTHPTPTHPLQFMDVHCQRNDTKNDATPFTPYPYPVISWITPPVADWLQ